MDEKQKKIDEYIKNIEKLIMDSISNNNELSELMESARGDGFNVNLNFMVVLGDDSKKSTKKNTKNKKTKITKEDLKFLEGIGIRWNY